ncbi:DUF3021 domain-containing protein [Streptococcus fryi]
MKTYWDAWVSGVGLGMMVYVSLLWLSQVHAQGFSQILIVMLGSGMMGLASLIYRIDSWSLLRQSISHLIVILGLVVAMGLMNGWFDTSQRDFVMVFLGQFILIYLLIWVVAYYLNSKRVKHINAVLKDGNVTK